MHIISKNIFFILLLGLIFGFNSCNSDDFLNKEPITEVPEEPENPEEPEEPEDPEEGEYVFSKTVQNVTQNPCGSMYCSIKEVIFQNGQIGYAISSVDIYKTTDLGETWSVIFNQDIVGNLNIISEDVLFINVYDGIAKTIDGFSTYTTISRPFAQFCPETGYFNPGSLQFMDAQNGFIRDDCNGKIIYKTNNEGENWTEIYNAESEITDFHFVNSNTGFLATNQQIYVTENGGTDWIEVNYLPDLFDYILEKENYFLLPGGSQITKPTVEGIIYKYNANDLGDIAVILHNPQALEDPWQLMLYVNNEEPTWVFVDYLPEVEPGILYTSLELLDDKTMFVSKTHSGEIFKYSPQ